MSSRDDGGRRPAILVDGLNVLYRGAFAMLHGGTGLSVALDGEETATGAAYRMLRTLVEVAASYGALPVVCWDPIGGRESLVRHKRCKDYKAGREPKNELDRDFHREVHDQRRLLNDLLIKMGVWQAVATKGWEADDVIATLARRLHRGGPVFILSNDKDMLPLIQLDGVSVINIGSKKAQPGERYERRDRAWWDEKYPDTAPGQWLQMRALMGDRSDGIAGVKGIGEVWAYKLIRAYGNAVTAVDFAESIEADDGTSTGHLSGPLKTAKGVRKKLLGQRPTVESALDLLKLNEKAPFTWYDREHDRKAATRELRRLRFKSFLAGTLRRQFADLLAACAA